MYIVSNIFNPKGEKLKVALYDSYITAIKNSVGSKLFKNMYVNLNGKKKDIARDGDLSCDIYVSSILLPFGLVDKICATVDGCVSRVTKHGWYEIKEPQIGSVLVWEAKKFKSGETHKHIGFYIGNNKAISNRPEKKSPGIHNWTFNKKRKVIKVLWNDRLNDQ